MKKKFIIISTVLIISIVGILGIVKLNNNPKKEIKEENIVTNSKEVTKTSKNDIKDNDDKEDKTTKVDEIKESPKKEEDKTNNNTSNTKLNTQVNSNTSNATQKKQEEVKKTEPVKEPEPVKKTGPWEAWGMSEDEYYNAPYPKGARVDYKVKDYGSEDACMNACTAKGDELYGYIYSCDRITSASGKFLGVMLDLEKVN